MAVKPLNQDHPHLEQVAKGLCQHVVGMAPKTIGNADDEPAPNKEDETALVHQEYLLDDTLTVKELLDLNQVEVVAFKRFECGETLEVAREQPLESVETCQ